MPVGHLGVPWGQAMFVVRVSFGCRLFRSVWAPEWPEHGSSAQTLTKQMSSVGTMFYCILATILGSKERAEVGGFAGEMAESAGCADWGVKGIDLMVCVSRWTQGGGQIGRWRLDWRWGGCVEGGLMSWRVETGEYVDTDI